MAILVEFGVVILILILVSFVRHLRIIKQHPPGPVGLPFVGLLPLRILQILLSRFLPKISQEKYFKQMKDKYGDIWSLDMGMQRIIGLASLDVLNEAFVEKGKIFTGRPIHEIFKILSKNRGIIFVDGELWQGNRQLAIKALRDLGMGKQILELNICQEVDELIEKIEENLSIPIGSPEIFVKPVANVISLLGFNDCNKYNAPEFESYIKHLKVITHSSSAHDILELFSKVLPTKYIRKIFSGVNEFINSAEACVGFVADKCRSRIKIEGEFSKPSCVFDYFWRYRYQDQPEVDPDEKFLDISHSMFDLFIAGSDTSTNVLGYACLTLGQYPDVQKELRIEIQSLVDDYTFINMDMRKNCPKLLSFIDEVLRFFHVAPFLHHRAIETCIIKGHKILNSDIVIGDIATSTRDPTIFENPNDFNPYRFLDESRTKYVPSKFLLVFGLGKRSCLGESIAVMELFLFLSKIIQRFNISLSDETKRRLPEILKGTYGIVHAPLDHEIIFQLAHL